MSEDMSISFEVVSDAAVFCDSFRRMWIIFTHVSFLLLGIAGGGVESCCDFLGLDGGQVRLSLWWGWCIFPLFW